MADVAIRSPMMPNTVKVLLVEDDPAVLLGTQQALDLAA
jgi:hypothetical protein